MSFASKRKILSLLVIKKTKVIIQITLWIFEADITDIRGYVLHFHARLQQKLIYMPHNVNT